jgi:hypothetical protein
MKMRSVIAVLGLAALLLAAGCMPFSGQRDVSAKANILGNTFEWSSTVAGNYTVPVLTGNVSASQ